MHRCALFLPLAAIALALTGGPASADMLIEVNNQSRVQIGMAISGTGFTYHVTPGGAYSAGPFTDTRVVEVSVSGIEAIQSGQYEICKGSAVYAALPGGGSSCTWIEAPGGHDVPATCTVALSGLGTRQCKVMILLAPRD
ncbi:hypothetical protein STVA_16050 [Allostella vacuolata]|nr:hypothetical protein STVA_16050 [Stella vacuolata]